LIGIVVQVLFLEVAGHNFKGVLGPLILSFHSRRTQLVVPHLLVLSTLYSEGSAAELFRIEAVFESNRTILA
jgi:hypothetical protein